MGMTDHPDHGHEGSTPHTHVHGVDRGMQRPPFREDIGRKGGYHGPAEDLAGEETGIHGHSGDER